MALKKIKTLNCGVTAEYWRIQDLRIEIAAGQEQASCAITLGLYIDKASRQAGKGPIEFKSLYFTAPMNKVNDKDPVAVSYLVIKQLEDFQGAEDV